MWACWKPRFIAGSADDDLFFDRRGPQGIDRVWWGCRLWDVQHGMDNSVPDMGLQAVLPCSGCSMSSVPAGGVEPANTAAELLLQCCASTTVCFGKALLCIFWLGVTVSNWFSAAGVVLRLHCCTGCVQLGQL